MKIIHINQQHELPFGYTPSADYINETVKSQLKVAQELKKYADHPIVVESLYEDGLASDVAKPMAVAARRIFPQGLPNNFNDLNNLQKEFLYKTGAARTLLYLGEIPAIYKSTHKETSKMIDQQISEGEGQHIFGTRESEAIACTKEAAIKKYGKLDNATVVLVYGAFHNFKPYCEKEGFDYELINTVSQETTLQKDTSQSPHSTNKYLYDTEKFQPKIDTLFVKNSTMNRFQAKLEQHGTKIPQNKVIQHRGHAQNIETYDAFASRLLKDNPTPFFASPSITNVAMPKELRETLKDSNLLENFVDKGYVTINQLIDIHQNQPWVINVLRRSNIVEGIHNNLITIDQLLKLSKEQVSSIKRLDDEELRDKVNKYIKDKDSEDIQDSGPKPNIAPLD